jgi:hypothetical protein
MAQGLTPQEEAELRALLRQVFQEPEAQTLLTVFERLVARRADMVTHQDFQDLQRLVVQLVEGQRELHEAMARLTDAQVRTEEQAGRLDGALARLTEAQARTEERVGRLEEAVTQLTQAQARTEQGLQQLTQSVQQLARQA